MHEQYFKYLITKVTGFSKTGANISWSSGQQLMVTLLLMILSSCWDESV